MDGLFDVVRLDVGENPNVSRIFPQRVASVLSDSAPLPRPLSRILLGHSDSIQAKRIVVALGEPQDHLVASRESSSAVEPMLEVPDDPVSEGKGGVAIEGAVEEDVDGEDAPIR